MGGSSACPSVPVDASSCKQLQAAASSCKHSAACKPPAVQHHRQGLTCSSLLAALAWQQACSTSSCLLSTARLTQQALGLPCSSHPFGKPGCCCQRQGRGQGSRPGGISTGWASCAWCQACCTAAGSCACSRSCACPCCIAAAFLLLLLVLLLLFQLFPRCWQCVRCTLWVCSCSL